MCCFFNKAYLRIPFDIIKQYKVILLYHCWNHVVFSFIVVKDAASHSTNYSKDKTKRNEKKEKKDKTERNEKKEKKDKAERNEKKEKKDEAERNEKEGEQEESRRKKLKTAEAHAMCSPVHPRFPNIWRRTRRENESFCSTLQIKMALVCQAAKNDVLQRCFL